MLSPLKIGLLGFGASAKTFHLPFFLADAERYEVSAVFERRALEAPTLVPRARVHQDLESFLADPSWELGVVTLPNDHHASAAIAVLQSGRAVVVEKPFATTVQECQSILAASVEAGRPAFAFQSRRLDGDFFLVKQLVKDGRFGRIVRLECRYDRWANALRKKAWKEQGTPGNSLLEDLGSHLIDQMLSLFGEPHSLSCRLGIQRDSSTTVDAFRISLDYNGLWVDLEASMVARAPQFHWSIQGTEGAFVKSGMDPQESQLQRGLSPLHEDFGTEDSSQSGWFYPASGIPETLITPRGRYADFYSQVASQLRGGPPSSFPAEDGMRVVRLLELCRDSARQGRSLAVHP